MRPLTLLHVFATLLVLGASQAYANTPQCNDERDGISYERKIEVCNKIIKKNPKDAQAYYYRGVLYWTKGLGAKDDDKSASIYFYELAIIDLKKTISLYSKNPDAYTYLASAYEDKDGIHGIPAAIAVYGKAMSVFPGESRWYNYRGIRYQKIKDFDRALADFTSAIEIDPNDYFSYELRGDLYKSLGETERGQEDINRSLELAPDDCGGWC